MNKNNQKGMPAIITYGTGPASNKEASQKNFDHKKDRPAGANRP
ncbi:hypothetical protein [Bacillus sp. V5-8f]|nr:hypothetical protein [Bacillus sp. V5-8f]